MLSEYSLKSSNHKYPGLSFKLLLSFSPSPRYAFVASLFFFLATFFIVFSVVHFHPGVRSTLPQFTFPGEEGQLALNGISSAASFEYISRILKSKDVTPNQNLASFTTTYMEPEAEILVKDGLIKNFADKHEYAGTEEIHQRCIQIISKMFNAPETVGTSTVGSSEAFMLAGLAMKWRWKESRIARGLPTDKPNVIMGATAHLSLKQFAKFFDVELRTAPVSTSLYLSDPADMINLVDENTIGIVAILGSTYNGVYEDIKGLNDMLVQLNAARGWDVGIHVDAASAGFVAPFLHPDLLWDFRLPFVRSINTSGHKYGGVFAGLGWVMWREKQYLPKELYHKYNYLGGGEKISFSINFSRPSHQVLGQYFKLIHLGFAGYSKVMFELMKQAELVEEGLGKLNIFELTTKGVSTRLPVVAFALKPEFKVFDEFELARKLESKGWMVPAYAMMERKDAPTLKTNMMRIVCRNDFTDERRRKLFVDLEASIAELKLEKGEWGR